RGDPRAAARARRTPQRAGARSGGRRHRCASGQGSLVIELAQRGSVAVLTIKHGKANAMDGTFCADLISRLDELRSAPARALVITGQDNIFSAGVHLV